jgi:putative transcriptional regulator
MPLSTPIPLPHLDRLRQMLSNRRSEMGITYDDLAALSGVSRRTLVAVETGKSPGSMETWFRLATALSVGFDEIFTAATALTTDIDHDPRLSPPVMQVRDGLSLGPTSDKPGAIYPDGIHPTVV